MSQLLNHSLGGFFGTTQGPTTTTTDFYEKMVGSHKIIVSQAIDKQSEITQNLHDNENIKEIVTIW